MPITIISTSSGQSTANADPCVVARPVPAPAAGDLIVADFTCPSVADPTITAPDGSWSLVQTVFDAATTGSGVKLAQYVKAATGSEGASDSWQSNSGAGAVVAYTVYRGVLGSAPVAEKATAVVGASSASRPAPSLTTTAVRLLHAAFADLAASTWTDPAGTTRRVFRARSAASLLAVDSDTEQPVGTYAYTATASASTSIGAQAVIALTPAPVTPLSSTTTITPTSGTVPADVTAKGAVTSGGTGTPVQWVFSWGDGTPNTGPQTSDTAVHRYTKPAAVGAPDASYTVTATPANT